MGDRTIPRCSLCPAYPGFTKLLTARPALWFSEFDGLSDEQLVDRVDGLLSGVGEDQLLEEDDRTALECEHDWEKYAIVHFLTIWGSSSIVKATRSFSPRPPAQPIKVVVLSRTVGTGLSLHMSVPAVTEAIHEFLRWFDESAAFPSGAGPT
ncbi:hypothetical protein [Burkholderia lata]|uniref:hypothetical protein n=1 Tax=Burkholderia lata (strain ATCC 17760 / DSM 23089 / LMG 22485 / NCIMB 9086 / R18194 / 383) TaxID=482957 RepID=UPI0015818434|nr:hypothetical protein [Burkholderia lata]